MNLKYILVLGTMTMSAVAFAQGNTGTTSTGAGSGMNPSSTGSNSMQGTSSNNQGNMSGSSMGQASDQGKIDGQSRVPASSDQSKSDDQSKSQDQSKDMTNNKDMSPKQVCQKLVDLNKNQTQGSNMSWSDQFVFKGDMHHWNKEHAARKGGMSGMHGDWLKQEISQADCSKETVAGDHAFVVAKSKDRERLIPFVKQGDLWKLDVQAYRSFYRMDSRTPASSNSK